jgi:hypothetical protein
VARTPERYSELRHKYAEMLAMRLAHARGEDHDARERMAALASRFPGALREIDDLELDEIRRRIDALDSVTRAQVEPEMWMDAIAMFHTLERGALCAKRWLAGKKRVTAEHELAFRTALASLPWPEDARAWQGHLREIAHPPRGRLTDLVFARIAQSLGTSAREARRLVFGVPRRER